MQVLSFWSYNQHQNFCKQYQHLRWSHKFGNNFFSIKKTTKQPTNKIKQSKTKEDREREQNIRNHNEVVKHSLFLVHVPVHTSVVFLHSCFLASAICFSPCSREAILSAILARISSLFVKLIMQQQQSEKQVCYCKTKNHNTACFEYTNVPWNSCCLLTETIVIKCLDFKTSGTGSLG